MDKTSDLERLSTTWGVLKRIKDTETPVLINPLKMWPHLNVGFQTMSLIGQLTSVSLFALANETGVLMPHQQSVISQRQSDKDHIMTTISLEGGASLWDAAMEMCLGVTRGSVNWVSSLGSHVQLRWANTNMKWDHGEIGWPLVNTGVS